MAVEEWKRKNPPIQRKPITNAGRIRAMTDEELAEFISKFCNCDYGSCPIMFAGNRIYCIHGCGTAWNEWLKKEVKP